MPVMTRRRLKLFFLCGLGLVLLLSGATAEVVERILAVVNDEVITQSEVDQMAKAMQAQPGVKLPPGGGKDLQRQLLDALIMQKLAKGEAKRRGISISDKELAKAFEDFKKQNDFASDEALAQVLAKNDLTIESFKQQLADKMLQDRLLAIIAGGKVVVTESEVHRFYDQEYPKTGGKQLHLKMLKIPFPPGAAEAQKEELKKKAELILQEHRRGVSWEELRDKHGVLIQDLGFVSESDLDSELAQHLAKVKTGDVAPIQTLQGFQLVQVVDRRDGRSRSFEEAAPEIRATLQRRAMERIFQDWMKNLREKAHVKIMK
ncbi:MAG: SurA N-terminal domain-containing protein [Desulfobaccales bacterium]